jgi:hypothetical protein
MQWDKACLIAVPFSPVDFYNKKAQFTVAVTSDSLNGFLFAGEMHLVHYNTKVCVQTV